jgi:uncharacterized protein
MTEFDVVSLAETRMRTALPFTEFVIKVYERCNLACKYCYMYEMADQSWQKRPVKMSAAIFECLTQRIVEHVHAHQLPKIDVVFHGGEPLLRGREFFAWATALLRKSLNGVTVSFHMQTNGTQLNTATLRLLKEHNISIGVSLDGSREANDRHRVGPKGTSSFDAVMAGVDRLRQPAYRRLFTGVLSVVDTGNEPLETYDFLSSLGAPTLDFLLPHANWDTVESGDASLFTAYADWLIPIFDRWYDQVPQTVSIRLFHNIMVGLLGGLSEIETIGLAPSRTLSIDTDGSLSQVDALKSAYEGAPETGLNVLDNPFDVAMHHPDVVKRQQGWAALSPRCRDCDVVEACGGGYYPHRYESSSGFDNPSVYCADLLRLIRHIRERMNETLILEQPSGESAHASI